MLSIAELKDKITQRPDDSDLRKYAGAKIGIAKFGTTGWAENREVRYQWIENKLSGEILNKNR